MKIKFLTNFPALFLEEERMLIISDLHLGVEHELYEAGIIIPPQAEKFKKIIDELLKQTKPKQLIILGDVKHKVPGISFREEREVPKFLEKLSKKVTVCITLGNHDTEIKRFAKGNIKVYSSRGFKMGRYGFFHGHAWPSRELLSCDWLFMGHLHPTIEFRDKFGLRFREQVWVRTQLNREKVKKRYNIGKVRRLNVIVLPAFNKLLGGLILNRPEQKEYFGPLLRDEILELSKAEISLLDGTCLGKLEIVKSCEINTL